MNFCDNQSRVGRQQWSICLNIDVRHRSISSQICVWQCRCERRQDGFQPPVFLKKNGGHTFFCMWQLSKYGKARRRNVTIKWTRDWCRKFCKDMTKKSCTGIKGMMFSTGVVRENLLKTAAFAQKKGDYYMWFNNQRKNKKNLEICRKTTTYCEWYRRYIQYFVLCERKYTNFSAIKILQNSCRNSFSTDFFTDCSFLWRSVA